MITDRYRKVYERGKPKHSPFDDFSIKHPAMDLSRRSKIFSPFDALKGFNEEIIPMRLQMLNSAGQPEAYTIKGYRKVTNLEPRRQYT